MGIKMKINMKVKIKNEHKEEKKMKFNIIKQRRNNIKIKL